MKDFLRGGLVAAVLLIPSAVSAQTTIVETTGVAPPEDVVTYVERETIPSVQVQGDVIVGFTLPSTVQLRTVPRYERYGYAIVNDRRVIVEPGTRRVIRVIER